MIDYPNQVWKEVGCSTASGFLGALAPTSEWFDKSSPRDWVFRGQSDAAWGLSPSAFREHPLLLEPLVSDPFKEWFNSHQFAAEYFAVRRFYDSADANGLRLPEDSQNVRHALAVLENWRFAHAHQPIPWPPRELWSLLALAQHYGVPTRLLDWSRNSYIAAYFAIRSAIPNTDGNLAVWAFSARAEAAGRLAGEISTYKHQVHLVTAPYAENPNLRAQRGVHLVLAQDTLNPNEPAERYDLLDHLGYLRFISDGPPLLKFVLPRSQARSTMAILAKFGVTAASLFPGYEGVVQGMHEEELWQDRKRLPSVAWERRQRESDG